MINRKRFSITKNNGGASYTQTNLIINYESGSSVPSANSINQYWRSSGNYIDIPSHTSVVILEGAPGTNFFTPGLVRYTDWQTVGEGILPVWDGYERGQVTGQAYGWNYVRYIITPIEDIYESFKFNYSYLMVGTNPLVYNEGQTLCKLGETVQASFAVYNLGSFTYSTLDDLKLSPPVSIVVTNDPVNKRFKIDLVLPNTKRGVLVLSKSPFLVSKGLQQCTGSYPLGDDPTDATKDLLVQFRDYNAEYTEDILDSDLFWYQPRNQNVLQETVTTGTYYISYDQISGLDDFFVPTETIYFTLCSTEFDSNYSGEDTEDTAVILFTPALSASCSFFNMQWTDTSTLEASTTYYYRAVLTSGDNTITSNSDSVTTPAAPATTTETTSLSWTDTSDLEASTTYYYRAVVSNGKASLTSNSDSVTTPAAPAPDTTAPTVTLAGEATINLAYGASWTDPGVTATDDSASTPTLTVTYSVGGSAEDDFDSTQAGTWTITYTATDGAGNTGTATRTVIVAQQTPATTTMQWTDTSTLNASTTYYYRAVVTSGDNTITSNTDSVATSAAPAADTTAPTVTLAGDATINLANGASWIDPGATATDETDGTLTVTTSGTVDTQTAGTYTITYSATDAAGNTGTATRTVIVAAATTDDPDEPTDDPGETTVTNYNLATTTFNAEAHATSSKLIRCALTPTLNQTDIAVVWQQTTTDPAGETTPVWATSTGTASADGSLVISGLTTNTKYWFRAVLTQGAQTQTTGSDPAWLTQIIGPAEAVHETGIIEKDFGEVMIFLARLTKAAGECLTSEEISTIKYTISKLNTTHYSDTFTAVTGHSTVTVANFPSMLEPYPLCEYGWDLDDIGYNFAFAPSNAVADPYSSEGLYKIEFIATLTTGEQLKWNYSVYFANKPTTPI